MGSQREYKSSPTFLSVLKVKNSQHENNTKTKSQSLVFTAVVFAATTFAGPALETRTCPTGPYKEGSACESDCLGALRCSDNLYDVVCTISISQLHWFIFFPFSAFLVVLLHFLSAPLPP